MQLFFNQLQLGCSPVRSPLSVNPHALERHTECGSTLSFCNQQTRVGKRQSLNSNICCSQTCVHLSVLGMQSQMLCQPQMLVVKPCTCNSLVGIFLFGPEEIFHNSLKGLQRTLLGIISDEHGPKELDFVTTSCRSVSRARHVNDLLTCTYKCSSLPKFLSKSKKYPSRNRVRFLMHCRLMDWRSQAFSGCFHPWNMHWFLTVLWAFWWYCEP